MCGVVWCGVVWCGVVWCGVVWCGVERHLVRIFVETQATLIYSSGDSLSSSRSITD